MPRRNRPERREILPDVRYNNVQVQSFINRIMKNGKKSVAYKIFYDALEIVEKKGKDFEGNALDIWKKSLENITPQVEVKSRRVGGATFQVPTELRPDRKVSVSMKNLILYARQRGGSSMSEKLAAEIIAAYNEEGGAFKKKEDTHRMAEANKAFAHFRF